MALSNKVDKQKRVLDILPNLHIQTLLEGYNTRTQGKYDFHWLSDPDAPSMEGSNIASSVEAQTHFNALDFVSKAVKYAKDNKIDSVIFYNDFTAFLSAIICQEAGLRGPSVQS